MNTYQLKRGILRLEGDRIFISGDQARYVPLLHLVASICWTVFFWMQAQKHYKTYLLTREMGQLAFTVLSFGLLVFWLYLGYTRGIKASGQDEIAVQDIVKAKRQVRAQHQAPLITLYLNNNRRRTLEFSSLEDLHFTDSLAGRGVQVVE
jgi:hypothetical protein